MVLFLGESVIDGKFILSLAIPWAEHCCCFLSSVLQWRIFTNCIPFSGALLHLPSTPWIQILFLNSIADRSVFYGRSDKKCWQTMSWKSEPVNLDRVGSLSMSVSCFSVIFLSASLKKKSVLLVYIKEVDAAKSFEFCFNGNWLCKYFFSTVPPLSAPVNQWLGNVFGALHGMHHVSALSNSDTLWFFPSCSSVWLSIWAFDSSGYNCSQNLLEYCYL